jgi:hypothetical protein
MNMRGTRVTISTIQVNGRHIELTTIFRRLVTWSGTDNSTPAQRQLASADADVKGHSVNSPVVCGVE